jgi:Rho-binding antiterminator
MSEDDKYTPIDCGVYSNYELAIMHRQKLRLSWHGDNGIDHLDTVAPKDLKTDNHEEFLIAESSSGDELQIRLDKIHHMEQL